MNTVTIKLNSINIIIVFIFKICIFFVTNASITEMKGIVKISNRIPSLLEVNTVIIFISFRYNFNMLIVSIDITNVEIKK